MADGGFGQSPVASGSKVINTGQYYTLSASAVGGLITLYIDGVQVGTYTDSSPYSFTSVGLRVRNARACFDDVSFQGSAGPIVTSYRYNDVTGALMHELDAAGNITVTHTSDSRGNLVSVRRSVNGQIGNYFYHYNAHGDVIAITGSNGSVVATFNYDPWGNPTEYNPAGAQVAIGAWAGFPSNGLFLLFGGMLYDAAAGLYLTKTRAYNPKTGRFLERDILDESPKDGYKGFPFGKDAIGTNLYAWCGNNPVTRVDPSGESSLSDSLLAFIWSVKASMNSLYTYGPSEFEASFYRNYRRYRAIQTAVRSAVKKVSSSVQKAVAVLKMQTFKPLSAQLGMGTYQVNKHELSPGAEAAVGATAIFTGSTSLFVGISGWKIRSHALENSELQEGLECGCHSGRYILGGTGGIITGTGLIIHAGYREAKDKLKDIKDFVTGLF